MEVEFHALAGDHRPHLDAQSGFCIVFDVCTFVFVHCGEIEMHEYLDSFLTHAVLVHVQANPPFLTRALDLVDMLVQVRANEASGTSQRSGAE